MRLLHSCAGLSYESCFWHLLTEWHCSSHFRSFPGGIYDHLIQRRIIEEYLIIDFRASTKRATYQPDAHMIVVTFTPGFESATITQTCTNRLIAEVRLAE